MMPSYLFFLVLAVTVAAADESSATEARDLDGVTSALGHDDECSSAESCALQALQLRSSKLQAAAAEPEQEGCYTLQEGEGGECAKAIAWAKESGFPLHPEWYPGLDPATSPLVAWQITAWNTSHPACPRPCEVKLDTTTLCNARAPPTLWKPTPTSGSVEVKVLSYNLFWWNLFKIHGGLQASKLLKANSEPRAYDVMGFQECEDPDKVLAPAGLQDQYTMIHSQKATCMGFNPKSWSLIEHGEADVADDMRTEYFGKRSAQWMRIKHKQTGMALFFMNHHGPLSVNSGGGCGGLATAHNLLHVMAQHAQTGDLLILVGDFNANAASKTIQGLWPHLHHVYNSPSFGGVDNIFSNIDSSAVTSTKDLGSGGSDHHAIEAVLVLGGRRLKAATAGAAEQRAAVETLKRAHGGEACLIEPNVQYIFTGNGWTHKFMQITDPRVCCGHCQSEHRCKSWTWTEWSAAAGGPECVLFGSHPSSSVSKEGYASGLPKNEAIAVAVAAEAKS
ncbi:unnamed protein product [Polarella glacialis]|uniref:Endonuclease/exonuclease/phosphatase domain-containing protein n=1 Tax=Polarella glacialis TaxID=89957 RepID=A0A813LP17_POLGL|nr:unnamed protein product [Polarella glacialis]